MNQQSTGERREFRAAELLTGGEHVNHQVDRDYAVLTYQVGHAAPYTDDNSVPMVALMLTPAGGGEPVLVRERRGVTLPIATEAEIAAAAADGKRIAVANALHELARRILNDRLPVPGFFHVSSVTDSREQLDCWAKAFGVEVRMSGSYPVASWDVGGLDVRMQSEPEPEPEPAADVKAVMAEAGRAMDATGDVEVYEPPADAQAGA